MAIGIARKLQDVLLSRNLHLKYDIVVILPFAINIYCGAFFFHLSNMVSVPPPSPLFTRPWSSSPSSGGKKVLVLSPGDGDGNEGKLKITRLSVCGSETAGVDETFL